MIGGRRNLLDLAAGIAIRAVHVVQHRLGGIHAIEVCIELDLVVPASALYLDAIEQRLPTRVGGVRHQVEVEPERSGLRAQISRAWAIPVRLMPVRATTG